MRYHLFISILVLTNIRNIVKTITECVFYTTPCNLFKSTIHQPQQFVNQRMQSYTQFLMPSQQKSIAHQMREHTTPSNPSVSETPHPPLRQQSRIQRIHTFLRHLVRRNIFPRNNVPILRLFQNKIPHRDASMQ